MTAWGSSIVALTGSAGDGRRSWTSTRVRLYFEAHPCAWGFQPQAEWVKALLWRAGYGALSEDASPQGFDLLSPVLQRRAGEGPGEMPLLNANTLPLYGASSP